MNKLFTRLGFIILAGILLLWYVLPLEKYGINLPEQLKSQDYKLGLDLQGWIELDYKVDLEEAKKEDDYSPQKEKEILEWLKRIIDKRIQNLQINDSVITTASYWGEKHIIVQIPLKWKNPEEDKINIDRAKNAIWKVTKIVFKERRGEITQKDLDERKNIAQKTFEETQKSKYNFSVIQDKFKDTYPNILTGKTNNILNIFSGSIDKTKLSEVIDLASWNEWFLVLKEYGEEQKYIFIDKQPSEWMVAKDSKWRILNDKYFVKSAVTYNEAFQPQIELNFNSEWADIFGKLSTRLVNKQMAIFVWGELLTAPNINEPILGWRAVITWDYTVPEANELSTDINTWVVPAPIYLTSEKSIDSKLWASSLKKLIIAGLLWFSLIFIFLIYTYRISWLLASLSLIIYVLIILTIVKYFWITLTLASIAGLILSIWMAIDANILIFERIQDELRRWEKMIRATKIWFKKSWSAIWDANVTGLIVAIILFIFGINLIKGFWLMLALWIIVSLFSVMWISRVLVFLAAEKAKNTKIFIWK